MKNQTFRLYRVIGLGILGITALISQPLLTYALANPVMQKPITVCVEGKPQITISWGKISGATSYSVFRLQKPQTQWINRYSKVLGVVQVDKYVVNATTYQYQVRANFGTSATYSNIVSVTTPDCTSTPQSTPPPPSTPTISGETIFTAYLTGYGWPDNTPPSAAISKPVIHQNAGGTGTYTDPITIAVGHSILTGKDILDFPAGTKFYIPALRRYFIVEDTCGDGSLPQDGPCHTGFQGHVWLDAWVGGQNQTASEVFSCENTITGTHIVIQNPSSNYSVVPGPIFNGSCITLFGDSIVSI